jgi:nucleoside-diphosphate-sugar epimerase
MKLLVTGNLGYIGTELTKYLKKKNYFITGFDSGLFKDCKIANFYQKPTVDIQIYSDIRHISEKHLKNIDAVIHLAAISNDPIGNKFENVTKQVNYISTKKLINLAIKNRIKRFVFASSCSMYGNAKNSKEKFKNEQSDLSPLTAYAKSKVLIEKYINKKKSKTLFTCLRFSTACGVSDRLRMDLVVNDFVASAISNKKIELLSDGKSWRPLIDVEDMCKALEWGVRRKHILKNEPLFINVGKDQNNILIKDLAFLVKKIFGNKVKVKFKKKIIDDRSYRVDFSKYRKMVPKKYQISKTIKQSVIELKKFLTENNFSIKNFRNSKYSRLYYLNHQINNQKLNNKINWK